MDNDKIFGVDSKKIKKTESAPTAQSKTVDSKEKIVLNFKVEVGSADYERIVADVTKAIDEILQKRAEKRLQADVDSFAAGLRE